MHHIISPISIEIQSHIYLLISLFIIKILIIIKELIYWFFYQLYLPTILHADSMVPIIAMKIILLNIALHF